MRLIDVENRKPIIEPVALLVKEFKAIWERDKTKEKERALQEFAFIYYWSDFKSPYKHYPIEDRLGRIRDAVITNKNWQKDEVVDAAIVRFEELQMTPSLGILEDAEIALTNLRLYFRNSKFQKSTDGTAAKNMMLNLKSLGDVVKSLDIVRKMVEQEQFQSKSITGKGTLGRREVPKVKEYDTV